LVNVAKKAIDDKTKQIIEKQVTPEIAQQYEFETTADEIMNDQASTTPQQPTATKEKGNTYMPLIIGAVVIGGVLYFTTKKGKQ
jgi:hypothetical protein